MKAEALELMWDVEIATTESVLARMCEQKRGIMSESRRWFDTPESPDTVGWGIQVGSFGPRIVSVPRK